MVRVAKPPLLRAGVQSLPGILFSRSPLLRREVGARLKLSSRLEVRTRRVSLWLRSASAHAGQPKSDIIRRIRYNSPGLSRVTGRQALWQPNRHHGRLRATMPLEPHLRAAAREPAAAAAPRRRRRPPGGAGRPGAAVRERAAVRALRARRGLRGLRRPGAVRGDHARDAAVAAAPRRVAVAVDEPAAGRSTRLIKLYLLRRSSRRRAASLADMGRTSASRGRAHVVTSVTWLK